MRLHCYMGLIKIMLTVVNETTLLMRIMLNMINEPTLLDRVNQNNVKYGLNFKIAIGLIRLHYTIIPVIH